MTEGDWQQRAHDQAMAMLYGGSWEDRSPDAEGIATGGCYNGDYPDSYHEALLKKLDADEYYEAEAEADMRQLFNAEER